MYRRDRNSQDNKDNPYWRIEKRQKDLQKSYHNKGKFKLNINPFTLLAIALMFGAMFLMSFLK